MAIIKPEVKAQIVKVRLSLESELLDEINGYCDWAKIGSIDHFVAESIKYVLSRDKGWKTHQESTQEAGA